MREILLKKQQTATSEMAGMYNGIPVYAPRGCHAKVVEIIKRRAGTEGTVIDLGAGRGALTQRLLDQGFTVEAYDKFTDGWQVKDIPCRHCDLTTGLPDTFNTNRKITAICAIEILEHLENPRQFLRGLCAVTRDTGALLVLSTPNPLETFACISLFTRGTFPSYSPTWYRAGHISILPYWLVVEHLRNLGASDIECEFVAPWQHPRLVQRAIYNVIQLVRLLLKKSDEVAFHSGRSAVISAKA